MTQFSRVGPFIALDTLGNSRGPIIEPLPGPSLLTPHNPGVAFFVMTVPRGLDPAS